MPFLSHYLGLHSQLQKEVGKEKQDIQDGRGQLDECGATDGGSVDGDGEV